MFDYKEKNIAICLVFWLYKLIARALSGGSIVVKVPTAAIVVSLLFYVVVRLI